MMVLDCFDDVEENFINAQPADVSVADGWTINDSDNLSPTAFFMQVEVGKGGSAVVVIGDEPYPGTVSRGAGLTVSWDSYADTAHDEFHSSGYRFHQVDSYRDDESLTLLRNPDTGGLEGTWHQMSTVTVAWEETDVFNGAAVGIAAQIPADEYLDGEGLINTPNVQECITEPCLLEVLETCEGKVAVTATFTGYDTDAWDALEDAEHPEGG